MHCIGSSISLCIAFALLKSRDILLKSTYSPYNTPRTLYSQSLPILSNLGGGAAGCGICEHNYNYSEDWAAGIFFCCFLAAARLGAAAIRRCWRHSHTHTSTHTDVHLRMRATTWCPSSAASRGSSTCQAPLLLSPPPPLPLSPPPLY